MRRLLKACDSHFPSPPPVLRKQSPAQTLLIFPAKQKLEGRCWLFLRLLHLVLAVIIIRRKKMELSGFQGLLAGQAVFRAKDFLQLGGLEKKPQTVSLTKNTHLKTDRQ